MNLLQNQIQCIECKNKKLIKDYVKKEVYCSKCGLVLVNNEIPTIKQRNIKEHIKQPKKDKTKRIQYHRLKKYFYNFYP